MLDDGVSGIRSGLADGFEAADAAAWRALVDKTLDGADFHRRLVSRTADGIAIQPLYTAAEGENPLSVGAPLHAEGRWDLRSRVDHPDPAKANLIALEELEGGASSLLLALDPTGRRGIAVGSVDDLDAVLGGVFIDLAPVALEAPTLGAVAGDWLLTVGERRTLNPRLALNLDPVSAFAASGVTAGGIDAEIQACAALGPRANGALVFLASGRIAHEAGATEGQELGLMLADAIAYAKALETAGLDASAAFRAIAVGLSADAEYFTTIAKLRAARLLWARLTGAATGAGVAATLEVRSSARMLAALDPWVNMLRLTAAAFGAAVGGADSIALDPFSAPLCDPTSRPTALARRQARNAQLVLMEEAALGRVADPAAGSWYLDALTRDLAAAGWAFMQTIEASGGIVSALETGLIAEALATSRATRSTDIARRKSGLIGVSEFPDLAEAGVDLEPVDPSTVAKALPMRPRPGPDSHCRALPAWRASAPFEALRKRAAAITPHPKVFLATLGAPADYAGRVGFARNLFAAGGLAAETAEPSDYSPDLSPIAVICSSDARYGEGAAAAAARLLSAQGATVMLAGRPGDLEAELRAAGVADFLYAGMDAPAFLDAVLARLERR